MLDLVQFRWTHDDIILWDVKKANCFYLMHFSSVVTADVKKSSTDLA